MPSRLSALLFPPEPRRLPWARGWNVAFRTIHLLAAGTLLGGHMFGAPPDRLIGWLWLTIASGAGLIAFELYRSFDWTYQVMGVLTELKLAFVIAAGIWWDQRVPLLIFVVILGSIGSHLPGRYRHFSVLHGRVLEPPKPPRARGPAV